MSDASHSSAARVDVAAAALDLFARQGFDQTSVEQIARAAGMSRSTFFRQFGGKEDVVFADHEALLTRLAAFLDHPHDDPWRAVCEAAGIVFAHFAAAPDLARRRYQIVREVPALREREIITVFRYEQLFDDYLRSALPGIDPLDAVGFSALIAAVHNHVLRRLLRGEDVPTAELDTALDAALRRYGMPGGQEHAPASDDLVVAVFPRTMPSAEVARRLRDELG